MKLSFKDIIGKHEGEPCVVAAHGPSLNPLIDKIQDLQINNGFRRISVNHWYRYFKVKPDYWTIANYEFTIFNSIVPNYVWDKYHQWEKNVFNKYSVPLFYEWHAENGTEDFISKNLNCDRLPYDTIHFQRMKCREILSSFKDHYQEHKNYDFKKFGNNSELWRRHSVKGTNCNPVYEKFAGAWSRDNRCCDRIDHKTTTIQEAVQNLSGHHQHVTTGVTVSYWAIMFAMMMKCNPIYVGGLDLDYEKGYANRIDTDREPIINPGNIGHWKIVFRESILNDLRIMKESANKMGIEIINLNKDSWHDTFPVGELP